MVGAWGGSSAAGEVFVVFGAATFPAVVGIADLDGSTGFVMLGATTSDAAGFSLAAAGVSLTRVTEENCVVQTMTHASRTQNCPVHLYIYPKAKTLLSSDPIPLKGLVQVGNDAVKHATA